MFEGDVQNKKCSRCFLAGKITLAEIRDVLNILCGNVQDWSWDADDRIPHGPRRHLNGLHRVVKANFTNHSLYTTRAQLLNLAWRNPPVRLPALHSYDLVYRRKLYRPRLSGHGYNRCLLMKSGIRTWSEGPMPRTIGLTRSNHDLSISNLCDRLKNPSIAVLTLISSFFRQLEPVTVN